MQQRLKHLSRVIEPSASLEVLKDYFTKRLNRVIADYLLREDYFETARELINEAGLKVTQLWPM